jgi:hypothetical protein
MNRLFENLRKNKYKTSDDYLYYLFICLLVIMFCLILLNERMEQIKDITAELYSKYINSNDEYIELKRDGMTYEFPLSVLSLEERINPIHDFLIDKIGMLHNEQKSIRFSFNPELSTNVKIRRGWFSPDSWQIIFRSRFEVKDSLILHDLTHIWSPDKLLENENFIVAEGFASALQYLKYPEESLTLLYPQLTEYYLHNLCGFLSNYQDLRQLNALKSRLAYELTGLVFAEIYHTDPIMFSTIFWQPPAKDITLHQFQGYMMEHSANKNALKELLLSITLFSPITQELYLFPQINNKEITGLIVFIGPLKIHDNHPKKERFLSKISFRDRNKRSVVQQEETIAIEKGYSYLSLNNPVLLEDINSIEIELQNSTTSLSEQAYFKQALSCSSYKGGHY